VPTLKEKAVAEDWLAALTLLPMLRAGVGLVRKDANGFAGG
jgi:hypothetical protein